MKKDVAFLEQQLVRARRASKQEEKRGPIDRTMKFSFMDGAFVNAAHHRKGKRRRGGPSQK